MDDLLKKAKAAVTIDGVRYEIEYHECLGDRFVATSVDGKYAGVFFSQQAAIDAVIKNEEK